MWENFKKTPYNDEGAVWMGKGRWILPVPGNGEKKITAAAKIGIIAACVVGIAFVILSFWLGSRPDYTYLELPHLQTIDNMIGQPVTDVAPAVGVNSDELIEVSEGTYKLPQGVIYAGIAFEITLQFEDEMLSGYAYTAGAPANTKEAAKNIAHAAEMFYIKSIQTDDGTRVLMNKGAIQRYLEESNQMFSLERHSSQTWDSRPDQDAVTTYLQKLENDPEWDGRVGEYLTMRAYSNQQIKVEYNPDTQWFSVQYKFFVDTKRA